MKWNSRQAHTSVTQLISMYSTFAPRLCRTAVMRKNSVEKWQIKKTHLRSRLSATAGNIGIGNCMDSRVKAGWSRKNYNRNKGGRGRKPLTELASKYLPFTPPPPFFRRFCYDHTSDSIPFVTVIRKGWEHWASIVPFTEEPRRTAEIHEPTSVFSTNGPWMHKTLPPPWHLLLKLEKYISFQRVSGRNMTSPLVWRLLFFGVFFVFFLLRITFQLFLSVH